MGARPGEPVGIIYGNVAAVEFQFAASNPHVKRLDYVAAEHPAGIALAQVVDVSRHSQLSFDEAVSAGRDGGVVSGDHVSCKVRVIGYRDDRGLLQTPRTPFKAGTEVRFATPTLIQKVLGLTVDRRDGAYLGHLKGTDIPVVLDVNHLVQKHVSVLAKTGAGKSYTVGVMLEELLMRKVPIVVIDPHGEYTTLSNPNIEQHEIDNMRRFGVKPKGFHRHLTEYTLEERGGGRPRLALEGEALEARELVDLVPSKLSSAQVGLLYQAINELKKSRPLYTFDDIVAELAKSPSNAKWAVISALEYLQATNLFADQGTSVKDLVKPGHATILNLKGTSPDVQEIAVARLSRILFVARKLGKIPPFMFVVEEAHNFCPERGISTATSGPELRTIASEGRKFGMGLLIISQRPAKVDKNVLSQCNTQIIMKVTNPNDLKAIGASVEGITSETTEEVQRLGTGVALVAGGNLVAPALVEVRTRMTRHGGRSVNVLVQDEDARGEPAADSLQVDRVGPVMQAVPAPETFEAPVAFLDPAAEDEDPPGAFEVDVEPSRFLEHEIVVDAPPEDDLAPGPWSADSDWPTDIPHVDRPGERPREPLAEDADPFDAPAPGAAEDLVRFEEIGTYTPRPRHEERPGPPTEPADADDGRLRPPDEPREHAVYRVLGRVGHERAKNPKHAMRIVRDMARQMPVLSPEEYVNRFDRVARSFCYPSMPECGPCPLLDTCRLGRQRLAKGEVRRGRWGSRAR
jgi:DNA helicase HerA-like ATPase